MIKPFHAAAALLTAGVLTAGVLVSSVSAAPVKPALKKPAAKMVTLYQADKCHMYFSPAQAKTDHYACPDSKGKMKMVKVTSAFAKTHMTPAKPM